MWPSNRLQKEMQWHQEKDGDLLLTLDCGIIADLEWWMSIIVDDCCLNIVRGELLTYIVMLDYDEHIINNGNI